MATTNVPIPQDKIGETFVWRDWFQKLSNRVFGSMSNQDQNAVFITGGTIDNTVIGGTTPAAGTFTTLAVDSGTDGQVLIGRTSDHHFVPATLTAGAGITITNGPGSIAIAQTVATTKNYGAFSDYTTQTLASTTAGQVMTFNTTDLGGHGVSVVSGSRLTVATTGVYNFQWSGQFVCTSTTLQDTYVWIRINGTDVVGSTGLISVPNSHAGVDGHTIAGWNFLLALNAGDYVQLVWGGSSTALSIATIAAGTSPTRPSTASLIATFQQI
jgi:hypothetical protein